MGRWCRRHYLHVEDELGVVIKLLGLVRRHGHLIGAQGWVDDHNTPQQRRALDGDRIQVGIGQVGLGGEPDGRPLQADQVASLVNCLPDRQDQGVATVGVAQVDGLEEAEGGQ